MKPSVAHSIALCGALFLTACTHQQPEPEPCGPLPAPRQVAWQEMETYAFLHYSLNTYTDQEWGFGNEDPALFNPSSLDVEQWVTTCRNAGMKGIILTAKHHCGFCLWPSRYTDFSVKSSPWKNGEGDVVRELSEECRRQGLRFGVYLSPWDRNRSDYGTAEYVTYFRQQLEELLTQYGDIFEVWFDGANGGDGWYGGANEMRRIDRATYYDWSETYRQVRQWQPDICIWADVWTRADARWVGTEDGYVGETNWSLLSEGRALHDALHYGEEEADQWCPGEVDTSIRPGWFYHEREDSLVKTVPQLVETYYRSVGRNANLLLNFPIMPNGRINAIDSLHGAQFHEVIECTFANDLAAGARVKCTLLPEPEPEPSANDSLQPQPRHAAEFLVNFDRPTTFDRLMLQEPIQLGQRVREFRVEALVGGVWQPLEDSLYGTPGHLTTIGYKRLVSFPRVTATQFRVTILSAKAEPLLSHIGAYLSPES